MAGARGGGGAARCGKLRQNISAPQGRYISAKLFLGAELIIAKLCRGTTMFARPLHVGDSVMGGQKGIGIPLGEIPGGTLVHPPSQFVVVR